jgi:ATP-dependent DNA helicase RecG
MTATPIPRTIARTFFGNLDVSFLFTPPKGRQTIKTWVVPNEKRDKSYEWMKNQIRDTGGQIFIICPLIEASEAETMVTVKAVTEEYEILQEIFPEFSIGLLHGRMKPFTASVAYENVRVCVPRLWISTSVTCVGVDSFESVCQTSNRA